MPLFLKRQCDLTEVFLAFFFFVAGGSYGTTWQHGHREDDDSGR